MQPPPFPGVADGDAAIDFLRRWFRTADINGWTLPNIRARYFGESFTSNQYAITWFESLPEAVRGNFDAVLAAFRTRWIPPTYQETLLPRLQSRKQGIVYGRWEDLNSLLAALLEIFNRMEAAIRPTIPAFISIFEHALAPAFRQEFRRMHRPTTLEELLATFPRIENVCRESFPTQDDYNRLTAAVVGQQQALGVNGLVQQPQQSMGSMPNLTSPNLTFYGLPSQPLPLLTANQSHVMQIPQVLPMVSSIMTTPVEPPLGLPAGGLPSGPGAPNPMSIHYQHPYKPFYQQQPDVKNELQQGKGEDKPSKPQSVDKRRERSPSSSSTSSSSSSSSNGSSSAKKKPYHKSKQSKHKKPKVNKNQPAYDNRGYPVCQICESGDHVANRCPMNQNNRIDQRQCFNCKRTGHVERYCRFNCRICGRPGHTRVNCRLRDQQSRRAPPPYRRRDDDEDPSPGRGKTSSGFSMEMLNRLAQELTSTKLGNSSANKGGALNGSAQQRTYNQRSSSPIDLSDDTDREETPVTSSTTFRTKNRLN